MRETVKIELVVDFGSGGGIKSAQLTGTVFVRAGERCFPELGWSDAVIPVLDGIVSALVKLLGNRADRASFFFFDGPFRIDIERLDLQTLAIDFVDTRDAVAAATSEAVSLTEWRAAVVLASERTLAWCEAMQYRSRDLDSFREQLAALSRIA